LGVTFGDLVSLEFKGNQRETRRNHLKGGDSWQMLGLSISMMAALHWKGKV